MRDGIFHSLDIDQRETRPMYPSPGWFAMKAREAEAAKAEPPPQKPSARSQFVNWRSQEYRNEDAAILEWLNVHRSKIGVLKWCVFTVADVAKRVPSPNIIPGRLTSIIARWLNTHGFERVAKGGSKVPLWRRRTAPRISRADCVRLYGWPVNRKGHWGNAKKRLASERAKAATTAARAKYGKWIGNTLPPPRNDGSIVVANGTRLEQALTIFWRGSAKQWREKVRGSEHAIAPADLPEKPGHNRRPAQVENAKSSLSTFADPYTTSSVCGGGRWVR
jgi:hypothetical protein